MTICQVFLFVLYKCVHLAFLFYEGGYKHIHTVHEPQALRDSAQNVLYYFLFVLYYMF